MPNYSMWPVANDLQVLLMQQGMYAASMLPALQGYIDSAVVEFQDRTQLWPFLQDTVDVTRTYNPPGEEGSRMDQARMPEVIINAGTPSATSAFTKQKYGGGEWLWFDNPLLTLTSVLKDLPQCSVYNPDNAYATGTPTQYEGIYYYALAPVTGIVPTNTEFWETAGTILLPGQDFNLFPYNAPARGKPWTGMQILCRFYGFAASVQVTGRWGVSATIPADAWLAVLRIAGRMAAMDILEGIYAQVTVGKDDDVEFSQGEVRDLSQAWSKFATTVIRRYNRSKFGL